MLRNYKSIFGERVYLSDEKWNHITHKHPEVKRYCNRFREVFDRPDIVKISKRDSKVHLYYKFYNDIFGGKYLLVITNSERKTIITAFITDKIKVGEVLWQKK